MTPPKVIYIPLCGEFIDKNWNKDRVFNETSRVRHRYEPQKLTGFTQVKGRRRLTKKQRKQLKNKKQ